MKMLRIEFDTTEGRISFEGLITLSHCKGEDWSVNGYHLSDDWDEDELRRVQLEHNAACLESVKDVPANLFDGWPIERGQLYEFVPTGEICAHSKKPKEDMSLSEWVETVKGIYGLLLSYGVIRVIPPAEVEEHERRLKYPVLAPGDGVLQDGRATAAIVEAVCETNLVRLVVRTGDDFDYQKFTQDECATKLESGEWVKFVREVKP